MEWIRSPSTISSTHQVASCAVRSTVFSVYRHWPMVWRGSVRVGGFLAMMLQMWRDCAVRGLWSLVALGPVAPFLIIWSCFLSFTSLACLACVLVNLGAAGVAICYLGYTHGLFIVGMFGILIMWKYGNIWITGILFIFGGYMFSLHHARLLILLSTFYALFYVNSYVGWHGVFISLNLSFLSHELLNKLFQGYDCANSGATFEEHKSEPVVDYFSGDSEYPPVTNDFDNMTPNQSPCQTSLLSSISSSQMDASSNKVVKADTSALDEIKRIISSHNHYEALGVPREPSFDISVLKKEYHKKARLVHPDKNMGNPLASESFKKLQCAYEVLSDLIKKRDYDEHLWTEESGNMPGKPNSHRQQNGVDYQPDESRRIECTKCGQSHIWICTNRRKNKSRWCQDCSMYHPSKDGDGWVEYMCSRILASKVEIPRAFVCAENKIFDASEWATCQGIECKPNTHKPSFHVNMVGLDKTSQQFPSTFPWDLDARMLSEDAFEVWLQHALASGLFSETPKRKKSWSPFKLPQKSAKTSRRSA